MTIYLSRGGVNIGLSYKDAPKQHLGQYIVRCGWYLEQWSVIRGSTLAIPLYLKSKIFSLKELTLKAKPSMNIYNLRTCIWIIRALKKSQFSFKRSFVFDFKIVKYNNLKKKIITILMFDLFANRKRRFFSSCNKICSLSAWKNNHQHIISLRNTSNYKLKFNSNEIKDSKTYQGGRYSVAKIRGK